MSRTTRTALTFATGLALALVALPARADHDRGFDRDGDRHAFPAPPPAPYREAPVYTAPAPAPAPVVASPFYPAHWRGGPRVMELRREYTRLEAARDHFYATWSGGAPWRRDRFEAWYASRRAELDRRWAALARGRGHDRWEG
ncbi:MAG TPA: hypothetical protein VF904_21025 [Anaeromyxobacteraceae bacterium]